MILNAWRWADQQAGRKRTNEVHGEEEIRIVLHDTFQFLSEEGERCEQSGSFEVEDFLPAGNVIDVLGWVCVCV